MIMALGLSTVAYGQDVVTGTSTAELTQDPGFEGLYKYCLEIDWDISVSGLGLSHLSTSLGFGGCACICDPDYILLDTIAGTGTGEPDPCTVTYEGSFFCNGAPTIPSLSGPGLKFEYVLGTCEPGDIGTMTVCFYSPAMPAEATVYTDALVVKAGVDVIVPGDLVGVMPVCDCAVADHKCTWGQAQSMFR